MFHVFELELLSVSICEFNFSHCRSCKIVFQGTDVWCVWCKMSLETQIYGHVVCVFVCMCVYVVRAV